MEVNGSVKIGAQTKVWHFSKLLGPLTIGERCSFGQNVVIEKGVEIGDNVKVQNNVSIYAGVILEDDVFCGPSMVFTNVGTPSILRVSSFIWITPLNTTSLMHRQVPNDVPSVP